MKSYKIILSFLFVTIYLLTGCAGRSAHPVIVQQPADFMKSKEYLMAEMKFLQEEINKKIPKTEKTAKNIALGTIGTFIFFPALFFMDLSKAEEVEIEALRQRYNYLFSLYITKINDKNLIHQQ